MNKYIYIYIWSYFPKTQFLNKHLKAWRFGETFHHTEWPEKSETNNKVKTKNIKVIIERYILLRFSVSYANCVDIAFFYKRHFWDNPYIFSFYTLSHPCISVRVSRPFSVPFRSYFPPPPTDPSKLQHIPSAWLFQIRNMFSKASF